MKIIKILKGEMDVDQKTYILWTLPFFLYLAVLMFYTSESRIDGFGNGLKEMNSNTVNGFLFLIFGLALFSMIWIFVLSARRFDLFGQSPFMALWMILIPAAPIIYLYLAFKKDLYYVKERKDL